MVKEVLLKGEARSIEEALDDIRWRAFILAQKGMMQLRDVEANLTREVVRMCL